MISIWKQKREDEIRQNKKNQAEKCLHTMTITVGKILYIRLNGVLQPRGTVMIIDKHPLGRQRPCYKGINSQAPRPQEISNLVNLSLGEQRGM